MITICTSVETYPKDYQTVSIQQLQQMLENGQLPIAYEVITSKHKQVRPYFDLDIKIKDGASYEEPEYYLEQAKRLLDKHFKDPDYAISSSNRPTKISYHIVVGNYLTTVQDLTNLTELLEFKAVHLDTQVYHSDNQKFRLIGAKGELSKNKPTTSVKSAINYEASVKNHLVTYIDPDLQYDQFEFKKIEKKNTIKPKMEKKESNDQLSKLIEIIDVDQIDDMDWLKIGYYCKSIDRFDLFDELSSRSKEYNLEGLHKKWKSWKPNGTIGIGTIEHYAKKTNPTKYLELNKPTSKHFDHNYFKKMESIDQKISYFNQFYFWYATGNCVFEISDLYKTGFKVRTRKEFTDHCADIKVMSNNDDEDTKKKLVPFSKIWFESDKRRVVYNVHFTPFFKEDKNDPKSWNIFQGFLHQYDPNFVVDMEKIRPVLDLIEIMADHDQTCIEYLINFFAQMIQHPEQKLPVGVVLTSLNQGTGKNSIIDFIGHMVLGTGFYHYTNNWEEFTAKFNPNMETCLLQCMDELASSGAQFKEFNRLKSILSQTVRKVEAKGKDAIYVKDYTRNFFCSNNYSGIVRVEPGDRRWFILNADNSLANNTEYFNNFYKNVYNEDTGKHFYHYLANINLSEWNFRKIPMTELKQSLMEKSLPQFLVFLINYYANKKPLDDGNTENDIKLISCVYDDFKQLFPKNQMNSRSFAISLYKLNDAFKTSKVKHGNQKCINMNLEMIKQSIENFTKISPFPFDDWVDFKSSECFI